jgi:hypothetical protein
MDFNNTSMSTPLHQLPSMASSMPENQPTNQNSAGGHDQLVEDILRDFDEPPQNQSNIDTELMGYAMDSSQIPPPKMNKNFLDSSSNEKGDRDPTKAAAATAANEAGYMSYFDGTESKMDWILNLIRGPAVVFIIVFVLSLPHFNRLLFGMIPSCLLESGQVNIYGVLLKALIGCILFILVNLIW